MSLTPDAILNCRDQKVLVIEPFFYTPHVETGLEFSELLSERNEVTYVGPDCLRCVTDETYKFTSRVLINCSRKRHVSNYLSSSICKLTGAEIAGLAERPTLAEVSQVTDMSAGDLAGVMFESFDLGMGVRSSLVSLTRSTSVVPTEHRNYALALARDAVMLYRLTRNLIRVNGFDIVVLFNGRFAPVRAIRRACEELGTRYFVHERGSSLDKYAIYDCATPHQPSAYRDWVDAWWAFSDDPAGKARDFLTWRRHGIVTNWYSFTRRQASGQVPPRSDRKRVTFFTSSEDELAAIGDELRPDSQFCDQMQAIRAVGAACRERGFEFVVRFHPNTPATASELIRTAHEASQTVCEPSSEVDSYTLFDSSDIVFTQNSTIGIEAASTGKPVFFTGRNIFERCRSTQRVMTDSDLAQALDSLDPVDPQDAFKYANFLGFHGIGYRYYRPRGIISGTYRGHDLNAPLAQLRELKLRVTRGGR